MLTRIERDMTMMVKPLRKEASALNKESKSIQNSEIVNLMRSLDDLLSFQCSDLKTPFFLKDAIPANLADKTRKGVCVLPDVKNPIDKESVDASSLTRNYNFSTCKGATAHPPFHLSEYDPEHPSLHHRS